MQYEILLTKNPNNGYTARPLTWPDLIVAADNEAEALALVRQAITDLQQHSRIVQIDVPSLPTDSTNDPWQPFFGMWAGDADRERFQAEVADFRQKLDQADDLANQP